MPPVKTSISGEVRDNCHIFLAARLNLGIDVNTHSFPWPSVPGFRISLDK